VVDLKTSLQAVGLLIALALTAGLAAWIAMGLVVVESALKVPDLRNLEPREAKARLSHLGLDMQIAGEVFSDTVIEGRIVEHDPAAGELLKPGRAVRIELSRGAARLSVPRVAGEALRQARLLLAHSGLQIGDMAQVHSTSHPAGTVLAQDPEAQSQAEPGQRVDLVVSLGAEESDYVMPDLINRAFEPVARFLRSQGFRIERVDRSYPGLLPGIIIRQYPEPGFRLRLSTAIRLEVSG
jgi:serine/threonine-protein kinase